MAQGGLQEQSIEQLEVGYWNVDWNWKGIQNQLNDVIKVMESNNCDIVFCTDTRTVENDLAAETYESHERLKIPLDYNYNNKTYKLAWIEEKEPIGERTNLSKRNYPGGICVIWKTEKIKNEQIKLDVIPVESKKTAVPGNDLEITKHRILTVQVSTVLGKVVFICCYGIPGVENYDDDAVCLFAELKRVTDEAKKNNRLIVVLGDLNARIGRSDVETLAIKAQWGVNGTNAYHTETNTRGVKFRDLCREKGLIITSVLFPDKLSTFQTNKTDETDQNNANTPEKKDQQGTGAKSDIDHFAIGWANPNEGDITLENNGDGKVRTVAPNGKGICTNIRVTERLPKAEKNFHRLCIASMDFRHPDDLTRQMDQVTV